MKYITEIDNLTGKRVLLRADLNVPTESGNILDDFRIRKAVPTLTYLQEHGARVIVVSHLGRKGESLREVARALEARVSNTFVSDVAGEAARGAVADMGDGNVVVLENVRAEKGEEQNDSEFAKQLASLADIYVNDAFAVSHREHASIVGVPEHLPSYGGLLVKDEIENLSRAFTPAHPFLFIIGGAKFETKIPLIKTYLEKADSVFVGGALAHTFFEAQGLSLGASRIEETSEEVATLLESEKLMLPRDVVVEDKSVKKPSEVKSGEKIVDAGLETVEELNKKIAEAQLIVANGPLGYYEGGYEEGTVKMLRAIAESSATSIIGGGDTLALVSELGLEDKFSFVSTGGGAMIQFLSTGTLPGIDALK